MIHPLSPLKSNASESLFEMDLEPHESKNIRRLAKEVLDNPSSTLSAASALNPNRADNHREKQSSSPEEEPRFYLRLLENALKYANEVSTRDSVIKRNGAQSPEHEKTAQGELSNNTSVTSFLSEDELSLQTAPVSSTRPHSATNPNEKNSYPEICINGLKIAEDQDECDGITDDQPTKQPVNRFDKRKFLNQRSFPIAASSLSPDDPAQQTPRSPSSLLRVPSGRLQHASSFANNNYERKDDINSIANQQLETLLHSYTQNLEEGLPSFSELIHQVLDNLKNDDLNEDQITIASNYLLSESNSKRTRAAIEKLKWFYNDIQVPMQKQVNQIVEEADRKYRLLGERTSSCKDAQERNNLLKDCSSCLECLPTQGSLKKMWNTLINDKTPEDMFLAAMETQWNSLTDRLYANSIHPLRIKVFQLKQKIQNPNQHVVAKSIAQRERFLSLARKTPSHRGASTHPLTLNGSPRSFTLKLPTSSSFYLESLESTYNDLKATHTETT